ncbi:energy transducer TonB [Catenovulum sediminis]|uniref:Protein TonB n=1 Tax=Catenovulum sediminis TaxID=1740262 RepID=A0ABV1RGE4_9ALTE|nr:energy transducer TonB [Catenovulum sediminis]
MSVTIYQDIKLIHQVVKLSGTVIFGIFIAISLFIVMNKLIEPDMQYAPEPTPTFIENFVMEKPQIKPIIKNQLPQPPQATQPPPPPQSLSATTAENLVVEALTFKPKIELGTNNDDFTYSPQDSSAATPFVRVEPRYPAVAARDGIEGWVELSFDINKLGQVENIQIIKSEPKRIFDRSAIKALSSWRYKPLIKNGTPQVQNGLTVRLDFSLAQ